MRITPTEVRLVQETFDTLKPFAAQLCEIFLARLSEIDRGMRVRAIAAAQKYGRRTDLNAILTVVVRGLSDHDALSSLVKELACTHVRHAVTRRAYVSVGCALIGALQQGLGEAFTAEVRDAWCRAYEVVADMTRRSLAESVPKAA